MIGAVSSSTAASQHDDLDRHARERLAKLDAEALPVVDSDGPSTADPSLLAQFDAMAGSRLIDVHARRMRDRGHGYYTIGSAGHESNAFVAAALRPTDPALLHYRSGAFFLARTMQAGGSLDDGLRAILLGMFASTADAASGGRHKVFGDASLAVIPQTSTIASHLPRAVGVALAIGRAKRIGVASRWPADAVTVCSFGDASINHSTAVGALNAAGYAAAQGLPLPLLFVCEDNGLGISVASPHGWVAVAAQRPGIRYFYADGADPVAAHAAAKTSPRWPAASASRCCCTCAPCASSATPAATSRAHTADRASSPPTASVTRCSRWPPGSRSRAWRGATPTSGNAWSRWRPNSRGRPHCAPPRRSSRRSHRATGRRRRHGYLHQRAQRRSAIGCPNMPGR
jgi:TPP-dependent pyruvate/acetoin dehydrogenase alpha subunit